jgi:hypothetical protein
MHGAPAGKGQIRTAARALLLSFAREFDNVSTSS